ncbi:PAS domain-containing protein [Mucilaginibacter antarcticus]|uniref:PAS domain-containing protein n=1 Tax=Mucilaginibacter antarcticus TaxID=1855725 RepID=UPI00364575A7
MSCPHQFIGLYGAGCNLFAFLTILISLVLPIRFGYWSVIVNTVMLAVFALIIKFNLFNTVLSAVYSPASWLAFSSNLVFASFVLVTLIHRIFERLQVAILKKDQLQHRYKSIFDKSPLPMWIFDTETLAFLEVNQAAVIHYGYTEEEFKAMTIRDIRPAEWVPATEQVVDLNKKSGIYYEGTSQHIKKDGSYIYVKIESNLLELDNNKTRLVLATDITDQVEHQFEAFDTHKKVKESEANLRAVFDSTVDGFVLLDSKFNIKLFNGRATELIRLNDGKQEFETGRSIFDFVQPARLPYFRAVIAKVSNGELVDYDRRYRTVNGDLSWIRYTLTPVYNGATVDGISLSGRDITVRKRYLKTVEDQNKTFREISWMQSHLVRAPLARIMGLIPLLVASTDKQDQADIVNYIDISATELDEVVRQISNKSNDIINKYPAISAARPSADQAPKMEM